MHASPQNSHSAFNSTKVNKWAWHTVQFRHVLAEKSPSSWSSWTDLIWRLKTRSESLRASDVKQEAQLSQMDCATRYVSKNVIVCMSLSCTISQI